MKQVVKQALDKIVYSIGKGTIIYYNTGNRHEIFDLVKGIKKETHTLLEDIEAYNLYTITKSVQKVKGSIAEVGVYKGGSAQIISEANTKRKGFYLFDTFEGLPKPSELDESFKKGELKGELREVKNKLNKYSNIFIYKGFFPQTAKQIINKKFSLVHLDGDLYKTTIDALNFFYPRLNQGGVIVAHDYVQLKGVKKAFEEFFEFKPEPIIELPRSQCLVLKCEKLKEFKK